MFPEIKSPETEGFIRYNVVQTNAQAKMALSVLEKEQIIAVDTETTGLDPKYDNVLLLQLGNPNNAFVINVAKVDPRIFKDLLLDPSKVKVLQNAIFDYKMLKYHYDMDIVRIFDTKLAELVLLCGHMSGSVAKNLVSLKAMIKKYFNIDLDKDITKEFIGYKGDPTEREDLVKYAASDVYYPVYLYLDQRRKLYEQELAQAAKLEFDLIPAMVDVELTGILMDVDKWNKIISAVEEEKYLIQNKMLKILNKNLKQKALWDDAPTVNVSSPPQMLKALVELGIDINDTSHRSLLENQSDELVKLLLEHREKDKFLTSFGKSMIETVNKKTGRIYAQFNQLGASQTGRMCIAAGSKVECVRDVSLHPDGIPIEEIKPGDLVYTYDDNLKLTLKKVKWVGKTGNKEVIRLHWRSFGRAKKQGYLDLTPEHKVRLTSGEYVEARLLKKNTRTLSLGRSENRDGYCTLQITGCKDPKLEHRFIYQTLFGPTNYNVHHKDENKKNNTVSNLEALPDSYHKSYHAKASMTEERRKYLGAILAANRHKATPASGCKSHNWLGLTKEWMENVLWQNCGKPTAFRDIYGIDYETCQKYLKINKINWKDIRNNFTKNGRRIDNEFYVECLKELKKSPGQQDKVLAKFGIGSRRWRVIKNTFEKPANNHRVLCIENINVAVDVYDLEVEDTHNFIVNGICVSNSASSPNLQQIPNQGFMLDTGVAKFRDCFIPAPGYKFVSGDYSQQEVRVAAHVFNEPMLRKCYEDGLDVYRVTASMMFNKPYDEIDKKSVERAIAKVIVLASNYGGGPDVVRYQLLELGIIVSLDEARKYLNMYRSSYPTMSFNMEKYAKSCIDRGYITFALGKKRYLTSKIKELRKKEKDSEEYRIVLGSLKRRAKNTPVQGNSAIMMKLAIIGVRERILKEGLDAHPVLYVHDEIVYEVAEKDAEIVRHIIKEEMEKAFTVICPGFPNKVDVGIFDRWEKE